MRFRRFLPLFLVGLLVSVVWACAPQTSSLSGKNEPLAPSAEVTGEVAVADAPTPAVLPPETQAIVASAGPNGLPNPPRGDVRLMVISDLNGPYGSITYDPDVQKAMQLIPFWQPDMVLCSGDMVAGQDLALTEENLRAMWNSFDEYVAAPLRAMQMPYGFTVGNHDASSALGVNKQFLFQKERDVTRDYWLKPEHDPGVTFVDKFEFPFYYTFSFNDIFFLAWDGSSSHIPDEKLAWVEQALSSEAAQNAKMRVLLGHLPLYSVSVGRNTPGEVMDNGDRLQALLERYNVHTYISGHHHAYYPAHKGNLQLLHMGILGAGPRPLIDATLPPWKTLTLVDVTFDTPELTTYTTYDIQSLQTIAYDQLPRYLVGHNGLVLRRDMAWTDLKPEEKAVCEQRLGREKCAA